MSGGTTLVVDAPAINSDKFPQFEGRIEGASDSVYPQSDGHSCCAADKSRNSTGAVLVQKQLIDKVVDVPGVLVIDTVVHSLSKVVHVPAVCNDRGEKLHHSTPRRPTMARAREEERDELHNATGQKTPPSKAASAVFFSLDDDGDVLATRPDRLYMRSGHRTGFCSAPWSRTSTPSRFRLSMCLSRRWGNKLVEVLQKIDTRTSHQVIEVPKIFPDSVPQRLVESRPPQMAEQLVEVPTEPGYALAVLAAKVFSKRELLGFLSGNGSTASGSRFLEEVSLTIQFLRVVEVVVHVVVCKVLAQDRKQQQRTWSRSLVFQLADVFHARVPQLPHRVNFLTMQMREFKGVFALFTVRKKSAKLGPHSGSELSADFTVHAGSLCGL